MGGCLSPPTWQRELEHDDPDRDWILNGVFNGFHIIDVDLADKTIVEKIEVKNYSSATGDRRNSVEHQIRREISNGRYVVVSERPVLVSAIGAVQKGNGGIRIIHDASRPQQSSLNSFCPQEHVSYQSIQDATERIGKDFFLAKVDLAEAYRSVKIHPSNYKYTGLSWCFGNDPNPVYMVDKRLCFGSRRAPYIFNKLTQSVVRMMKAKGFPNTIAFLDDFLLIEKTRARCNLAMQTLMTLLRRLGFAINYKKLISPTQCLTFLGVELDSRSSTMRLPEEKLQDFKSSLSVLYQRKKATKKELQKLAGKLNWATQCIYGGVFHLRRIHDVIARLRNPWHRARVTGPMKQDMHWWLCFLEAFNGTVQFLDPRPTTPVYTDACKVAAGMTFGEDYGYFPWQEWPEVNGCHINVKETLAIELALSLWASRLQNKKVLLHCDNKCAVAVVNKGSSNNPVIMASLRRMFWLSVKYNFKIIAQYYPAGDNVTADAISRLHELSRYRRSDLCQSVHPCDFSFRTYLGYECCDTGVTQGGSGLSGKLLHTSDEARLQLP